jgi:hypothetical protein
MPPADPYQRARECDLRLGVVGPPFQGVRKEWDRFVGFLELQQRVAQLVCDRRRISHLPMKRLKQRQRPLEVSVQPVCLGQAVS